MIDLESPAEPNPYSGRRNKSLCDLHPNRAKNSTFGDNSLLAWANFQKRTCQSCTENLLIASLKYQQTPANSNKWQGKTEAHMELLTQTNLHVLIAHRSPMSVPNPIPFAHVVHLRNCYA
jgi:hypothetical protein